jgi:hypothetical protein
MHLYSLQVLCNTLCPIRSEPEPSKCDQVLFRGEEGEKNNDRDCERSDKTNISDFKPESVQQDSTESAERNRNWQASIRHC